MTGFVGIGTSTPNAYNTAVKLKIYTPTYSIPLLVIEAGIDSANNNQNARAIGKPLLGLGNTAWSGIGDYYGIGFGWHAGRTNDCYTCEIGCIITDTNSGEMGDLVFSTRNTNNNYTAPTERMRIKSDGAITINNNTTLLSSLNVSGITTLNNTTIVYGQLSTNGNFTNGTTSNLYAGGLRINGSDYNNTIYQDLVTIGWSL